MWIASSNAWRNRYWRHSGVGDEPVHGQHQVIGDQRVRRREESQVAFDDHALIGGEPGVGLPQRHVRRHVDLLRHPVVGAAVEVLLPGPVVFEGDELVEICAAVDHSFLVDRDALPPLHFRFLVQARGDRLLNDMARGGGWRRGCLDGRCNRHSQRWLRARALGTVHRIGHHGGWRWRFRQGDFRNRGDRPGHQFGFGCGRFQGPGFLLGDWLLDGRSFGA